MPSDQNPRTDIECEVAVIGAGTAGLAAERSARRAGAKTLLIDERFAGTTCASVGCMPSKLLIAAAKVAHSIAAAPQFGIYPGNLAIDGKAVMHRVRTLRDEFVASVLKSIDEIPDDTKLMGKATFASGSNLRVGDKTVRAKSVVIATGSKSSIPKTFDRLDNILTNETIFELEDLPSSLAVIGAGPLGLELAQAFSRLGVEVMVFDEGKTVSALKDEDVAESLHALLEQEFPIRLSVDIDASSSDGAIELSWSGASQGKMRFTHVLVATGRPPNLDGLGLDNTGIELDEHGTPLFDRQTMRCGKSSIFLAGDSDAQVPILHEASAEGAIAGNNAARFPEVRPSKRSTPLAITFTDPPSASIGVPADEDAITGVSDFSDQGRAKVEGRNVGMIRLYADNEGRLTGATLAAPEGEHFAHMIAWAIEDRLTAMQLLDKPFYHPTYEEGLRSALKQICDQTRLPFGQDRDAGSAPGV
ncbi:dihydrolipoamide dehydrogenase [Neorhizobium huautlense]|uniref:Dihydrolipoamide dehydrogenase n=1 Tax=Neorhizobium huautlense TaxID=67774 RepID=A0ABT9PZZ1_9HYPH|nr:dihydrolipoyl dehydrogenase [Neorhizobium huautlense]MDP9840046.1 dihydrolipoamide dehydrogenase [Neorhizobium huautlense]